MKPSIRTVSLSGVAIVAAAALFILIAKSASHGVGGPPKIVVDRTSQNWGHVRPATEVSTTFRLENSGGIPLRLDKPTASCGCTAPTLVVRELRPGEATELRVQFRVPEVPGPVRHTISFTSS